MTSKGIASMATVVVARISTIVIETSIRVSLTLSNEMASKGIASMATIVVARISTIVIETSIRVSLTLSNVVNTSTRNRNISSVDTGSGLQSMDKNTAIGQHSESISFSFSMGSSQHT